MPIITIDQLKKYIHVIEKNSNCKVVGLSHDDMEPIFMIDIFVNAPFFDRADYLYEAHFDKVDFASHTMRFHIFDDEMQDMMNTIALISIEEPAPKLMN